MLLIKKLSAHYGNRQILHDISLNSFAKGEMVGLIGPNAAGKSTFFKTLAGIHTPSAGEVSIDGKALSRSTLTAWSRQIAMMPQQYEAKIALTVFDSVLLALKTHSQFRVKDEDLQQVTQTLREFGIGHLAERRLDSLSGGQKQMAAIARILVRHPPVALLDEPTSALDLHHQLSAMQMVADATRERGLVSIVALHNLNLAAAFCNRLLLMHNGRILLDDIPEKVLSNAMVEEVYRVNLALEQSQRQALFVDAWL